MKALQEHINESLVNNVKDKVSTLIVKMFNPRTLKYLNKKEKDLYDYITKYKQHIHFDVNDQSETGYQLSEHGLLNDIDFILDCIVIDPFDSLNKNTFKKIIKSSDVFRLSKDEEWFWYMPGFDIIGINFNDIDEEACIQSTKEFYKS